MAPRAALVLIALTLLSVRTEASECPLTVRAPVDPKLGYGPRQGGTYCDGQLREDHGGHLRVIAMTVGAAPAGRQPFSLDVTRAPALGASTEITIQGLPLQPAINYRFDASLKADRLPLTVGDESALWRLEKPLTPAEVGWSAWSQAPGSEKIYWPLILSRSAGPSEVSITLRSSIRVSSLDVTIREAGKVVEQKVKLSAVAAPGAPLPYRLPAGPAGLVTLDVTAIAFNGFSQQSTSFLLWRPAP